MFSSQVGVTPIANVPPLSANGGGRHTPNLPKFAHDVVVGNEMKPSAHRVTSSNMYYHARGAVAKVAKEKAISEKIMENISSGINHMSKVEHELCQGYKKAGSGQPNGLEWTHSDSLLAKIRDASSGAAFVVSPHTAFDDRSVDSLSSSRSIQSQASSCASPRARSGSLLSIDVDPPRLGGIKASPSVAEPGKEPIVSSDNILDASSSNSSDDSSNGVFEAGSCKPQTTEDLAGEEQRKRETPVLRRALSNLTSAMAACEAQGSACVDPEVNGCAASNKDNDVDKVKKKLVPHQSASPSLEKATEKIDCKRSKPIAIAGKQRSKEEASSSAPAVINIERAHAKIKGRRPSASKQDDALNQSLDERSSEVAEIMATADIDRQYSPVDEDGEDPEISMINN